MNPIGLYDAHLHLADPRFASALPDILEAWAAIDLQRAVVMGTSSDDWERVLTLCAEDSRLIPAIGLHPWRVGSAPPDWREQLHRCFDRGASVVGEIGLDQWVEGHDIESQMEAFRWQFALAAERNLPTSIHCLKAHEPLLRCLRESTRPERGFKIHAYNGPVNTLPELLQLGAYFSFNAGQLKPGATRVRELIRQTPDDRLLIETDAPDFTPPPEFREYALTDGGGSKADLNHPANLRMGYEAIAAIRDCSLPVLRQVVADNFNRYYSAISRRRI